MGKIDIASLIKHHEHLVYEMATYKWASALTEISNDDYGKIKPQVAQLEAWRKRHIGRSKRVDELTAVKFCARLDKIDRQYRAAVKRKNDAENASTRARQVSYAAHELFDAEFERIANELAFDVENYLKDMKD